MYRWALILTAFLCAVDAVGAAPVPLVETTLVSTGAALTGLWLPLADKALPESAETGAAVTPTDPAGSGQKALQEIVAGILTGSFAAVLALKLIYGRRRRRDGP